MDRKSNSYIEMGKCPSDAELSSFFDREEDCSVISRHLVSCQRCRDKMAHFELVESVLSRHLQPHEPEELLQNIRQQVSRQLDMPVTRVRRLDFPRLFFRTAAVFAIASLALFYGSEFFPATDSAGRDSDGTPGGSGAERLSDSAPVVPYGNGGYRGIMPGIITENSVPLSDMVGVNYGNREEEPVFRVQDSDMSPNAPVMIAPEVHQVWVAERPGYAARKVMNILKRLKVSDASLSAGDGQFTGNTLMTKMQLVKFVRSCKKAGLNLLSPQAPQPEQNRFRGHPDSLVRYQFDIVTPGQ